MMNLVTGATGHIGNVVVRKLLERGEKVRAFIWRGEDTSPIKDLDLEKVEGDVLDLESLRRAFIGVENVFHLAGIISILPGKNSMLWRINVDGTRNVLTMAKESKVKRLIYTSSIHAIRRVPQGMIIDESLPYDPDNPYGEYDRSKAAASLVVQKAAEDGLNAVLVCPTGVIGPYDFRLSEMGAVIRSASEAHPMFYVDGAYDFVDVRDVADGIMLADEKGRRGESYILGGQRISVIQLLETIFQATGKAFKRIKIPFGVANLAAKLTPHYYRLTKSKPRFTSYSLEVLQSNSDISHTKAERELGYHPRPLAKTISDTVRWFLENPKLLPS